MLLHRSQTPAPAPFQNFWVWYLMFLHHSQTTRQMLRRKSGFGILCFYIILKHMSSHCAFSVVWYLMFLHHSQTGGGVHQLCKRLVSYVFTSFSNPHPDVEPPSRRLVSYAFTSFSNMLKYLTLIFINDISFCIC